MGRTSIYPTWLLYLTISNFTGKFMSSATFIPFNASPDAPPPWTPFSLYDHTEYLSITAKYAKSLTKGMGGLLAEGEYKRLSRTFCLLSPHRKGSKFGPSGVWDLFTGPIGRLYGIGPDIGLLFDDLFLALSHPTPNREWYTQLAALRDALYLHWKDNPRNHTKCCTLILVLICNALAIMDGRFLAIRNGKGRKEASNLTAAFPIAWREFFCRSSKGLHSSRLQHVLEFLRLQLTGTTGSLNPGSHLVYLMLAGNKPYVGRTINRRAGLQNSIAGIAARWSEHVRELQKHVDGKAPSDRQRRRYNILKFQQPTSCLNFLIIDQCDGENIAVREAVAITMVHPPLERQ